MSVNVSMKFTLATENLKGKTLSEIRSTKPSPLVPSKTTRQSGFNMINLGRNPMLTLNKISNKNEKQKGCGCCGG